MESGKKVVRGFLMAFLMVMALALAMPTSTEAASKVKLNKTKATVSVGYTVKLKVKNTSKKVKWSSSKKSVATVSKKGVVKGKKKGKATITAKVGKKKLKCKVTVKSNTWSYSGNYTSQSAWTNIANCDNTSLIFAKAQPVKYKYSSKGNLVMTVAVYNNTYGYNYHLTNMTIKVTNKKGKVIAKGTFSYDCTISPLSIGTVKATFNNGGTKKKVDLRKTDLYWSISTN